LHKILQIISRNSLFKSPETFFRFITVIESKTGYIFLNIKIQFLTFRKINETVSATLISIFLKDETTQETKDTENAKIGGMI